MLVLDDHPVPDHLVLERRRGEAEGGVRGAVDVEAVAGHGGPSTVPPSCRALRRPHARCGWVGLGWVPCAAQREVLTQRRHTH